MITFKQFFSLFLSGCLIYSQVLFNLAYAEGIVTDGSTQTTLDKARNGVPVVNIAKPSSKGLSHNKFRKFNVGKQGVILNNSGNTCVKTQLGGYIFGNKHLAGGSAKVILNEVTGSSRSHLRGYTEVAGRKADLVLVNPNGISLNGAGFINVPTITFATGQVNVSAGAIDAFSVNQGDVRVEGDGLDTQTQRATYIYAKTLQLNAKLHAQDLNVALGSNEIDYATKQIMAQPAESKATADAVLLDSSALGGMYAGRITLVGTDKGVGVNLPPEVLASNGEITITADGKIQLQDLAAQTDLAVTSVSDTIELQGTTHSGDTTRLTAGNEIAITDTATVASEQAIELSAGAPLVNRGTLLAGITAKGAASHTGTIRVDSTELINRGTIATGTLQTDTVTNTNAEITARQIQATTLNNRQGLIKGGDSIAITTTHLDNTHGRIVAADTLQIETQTMDLDYSSLYADQQLDLKLKELYNTSSSQIESGGNLIIEATDTITNHAKLAANGDLSVTTAGIITNHDRFNAQGQLTVMAGKLENHGSLVAGDTLTTHTTDLTNHQTLFSHGEMNLYTTGTLHNSPDALIFAMTGLTLAGDASGAKSTALVNDQALIESYQGDLAIHTTQLHNTTTAPVKASSVGPTSYRKVSGGHRNTYKDYFTTITTESFSSISEAAKITAGRDLTIEADAVINDYSLLAANRNLALHTASLQNTSAATSTHTHVRVEHYKNKQKKQTFGPPKDKKKHAGTSHENSSVVNNRVVATIQAGGSISITGGGMLDNGNRKQGAPVLNARTADLSPAASHTDTGVSDVSLPVPTGQHDLFIRSPNPDSRYLIETNPEFALYKNFISSDYLMGHLEIDPAVTTKRVGDAFYENRLIRDAVLRQTGRRFLDKTLKNDRDQFKYLMDNALKASTDLKLQPGIALSRAQIDRLTSDIVWMEERVVHGHRVLVPVLYLANTNNYLVAEGSRIIAGENVTLEVASMVNSGSIEAGDSLSIAASDAITNLEGSLLAERDLRLQARNDIRNTSGTLAAESITIQSEQGSFIHETYAEQVSYGAGKVTDDKTLLGQTGQLQANGTIDIDVAQAATFKGSTAQASDMTIRAGEVHIGTIVDERNFHARFGDGEFIKEAATTHHGSQLETDNLTITSQGATIIEGSTVQAHDTLAIKAATLDILSVNDTSQAASHTKSDGTWSSSETSKSKFNATNKASSLKAANMELTTTDGDITIVGSELTAAEALTLDSARDLTITTGYDGSFQEEKTRESGFFRDGQLYSEEEDLEGKLTKIAVASRLSGGNVTLKSNRELLLEGSDLSGGSIRGEAQSITIKAANNEEKTWSRHVSKSIGLGDLKDSLLQPHKAGTFEDKKLTLKIADAQYEEADKSIKKTTVTGSNLTGDSILLTAASEQEDQGTILVEGSNLTASESIALTASNDVIIKEAKETTETKTASKKGTAELTANVKHQAVEVVKAAEALQQAIKAAQSAKDAYDDYKDQKNDAERNYKAGLIEKEDLDDVRDDERFYVASVTLTAASVVSATKNLTAQAIAATQSASTYGFNADIQLDIDAVVEKAKDISTRSVGSNLAANSIEIKAGNKALVQGSHLTATEQIAIDASEVELAASRDTTESSSSKDHAHFTYTYSAHGGPMASGSTDFSESQNKSSTYNNATLNSNTISITSKQDTYVTGAVVKAEETLELDVGGDLTVASLQDRSRSKSNSVGASAGSGSVSANASLSKGKKQWVTEQTALEGGQVTIDVEGHTELKGARIAAVDANGNDTGQLSLSTDTLSYDDIRDRDANSNLLISGGTDGFGSAGLGFSDSTQLTKAAIGQGTIRVGDETNPDLKGLNRDVDQSVVGVKNTGVQLDMDAGTLDVVTSPYDTVESIVDDSKQIGVLAKTAKKMVDVTLENDGSLKEGADAIAMGFNAVNNPAKHARSNTDLGWLLANTESMDADQLQEVVSAFFQDMQAQGNIIDPATMKLVSTDGLTDAQIKAYHAATNEKTLQSYLNIQKTDVTDGSDLIRSLSAETIRQQYARGNKEGDPRNEALEEAVEHAAAAASQETWNMFSDETETDPSVRDNWVMRYKDSDMVKAGNKELNATNSGNVLPYMPEIGQGNHTSDLTFTQNVKDRAKNGQQLANGESAEPLLMMLLLQNTDKELEQYKYVKQNEGEWLDYKSQTGVDFTNSVGLEESISPFDFIGGPWTKKAAVSFGGAVKNAVRASHRQESKNLFRSVSKSELDDVVENGFRNIPEQMSEKWFAETAEDASEWARKFYKWDKTPKHIVKVKVPKKVGEKMRIEPRLDGIGPARSADDAMLNQINKSNKGINELPALPIKK